jgi:1-acyl-sn-glycerol-3-phosphate acyltransferase
MRESARDSKVDALARAVREIKDALASGGEGFDPNRLDKRDPALIADVMPLVRAFKDGYIRMRAEGLELLKPGPTLYVSNHNGGIAGPDLLCTLGTLWEVLGPEAPVYALAHDFAMRHLPPFGSFIQRFGGVRAARSNAERVLRAGGQVLVYPGGDLDAYRHFNRRNEVVFGQRTGFVSLAKDLGVPIVPIVAYGAHRSAYIFTEGEGIARVLRLKEWGRLERFPVALALPWGIAPGPWLPYLPLPLPVGLRVLPPVRIEAGDDPAEAREHLRSMMQTALTEMAKQEAATSLRARMASRSQ